MAKRINPAEMRRIARQSAAASKATRQKAAGRSLGKADSATRGRARQPGAADPERQAQLKDTFGTSSPTKLQIRVEQAFMRGHSKPQSGSPAEQAAIDQAWKAVSKARRRGVRANIRAEKAEFDKQYAAGQVDEGGEPIGGAPKPNFPKTILAEDPSDDNFSDAAGMPPGGAGDENDDVRMTVLHARKAYLDNANKAGSDTSKADKQLAELLYDLAESGQTQDVTDEAYELVEDLALRSKEAHDHIAGPAREPFKGPDTSGLSHQLSDMAARSPAQRRKEAAKSAKAAIGAKRTAAKSGKLQEGPANLVWQGLGDGKQRGSAGNWRLQKRDPRTGRWV